MKITRFTLSVTLLLYSLPGWCATGLGSLGALHFLFFLMLGAVAVALVAVAYLFRRAQGARKLIAFACLAIVLGYIAIGVFGLAKPRIWGAINPWLGGEATLLAPVCLALLIATTAWFLPAVKTRLMFSIGVLLVVLNLSWVTPGARIYYPNHPLDGEVTTLQRYDSHHAELADGRILFFPKKMPGSRPQQGLDVVVAPVSGTDGEAYQVLVKAKRYNLERLPDKVIKGSLHNPFFGYFEAREYGTATVLPPSWQPADELLIPATGGYNYKMKWARELLKRGADPNFIQHGWINSMVNAIGADDLEMLELLLDNGGNLQIRMADGDSLLMEALRRDLSHDRPYKTVKHLIDLGVDIHVLNNDGKTALDLVEDRLDKVNESTTTYPILVNIRELLLAQS